MEIIPAILPKNYFDLEEKLARVRGLSRAVQIDICDGKFTPRASWPYGKKTTGRDSADRRGAAHGDTKFNAIISENAGLPNWEDFDFEIDLMVANPSVLADEWVAAGASRLVIHQESVSADDFQKLAERLSGLVAVGVALNSATPVQEIESLIPHVSFVQYMGIRKIGFQGQSFDDRVIDQVSELRKRYPELTISVDGGVNLENGPLLLSAGANRLVVGSALFENENIAETMRKFRKM